jgi:hypothetical protein
MAKSELVGYVRKSQANGLKICILKDALDKAQVIEGKDGTKYVSLILNLSKVRLILEDAQEVTSICQLVDDDKEDQPAKKEEDSVDDSRDRKMNPPKDPESWAEVFHRIIKRTQCNDEFLDDYLDWLQSQGKKPKDASVEGYAEFVNASQ